MIELLVVIAIIAILAGLTLGTLGYVQGKGARARAESEVSALAAAIDSFKLDFGLYPSNQATLYIELIGSSNATVNKGGKVYFEPTPNITTNLASGPFIDPWGSPYNYNSVNPTNNVGFFDLWSTAGGKTNQADWIRN